MSKVIYLPLEPIENRCFGYWYSDFHYALRDEFGDVLRLPVNYESKPDRDWETTIFYRLKR